MVEYLNEFTSEELKEVEQESKKEIKILNCFLEVGEDIDHSQFVKIPIPENLIAQK